MNGKLPLPVPSCETMGPETMPKESGKAGDGVLPRSARATRPHAGLPACERAFVKGNPLKRASHARRPVSRTAFPAVGASAHARRAPYSAGSVSVKRRVVTAKGMRATTLLFGVKPAISQTKHPKAQTLPGELVLNTKGVNRVRDLTVLTQGWPNLASFPHFACKTSVNAVLLTYPSIQKSTDPILPYLRDP